MPHTIMQRFEDCIARLSGAAVLFGVIIAGCVSAPITAPSLARAENRPDGDTPFVDSSSLDPGIPSPSSILGHTLGDGAIRYNEMQQYLKSLADSSPLITWTPYARSHEGRELFYLTITSERNHARLSDIKKNNAKIADPRQFHTKTEAEDVIADAPGIAWLAYSIHGDELSSTDAAVQLAYQLVAGRDEATKRLREELVINIDPLMNPDGRERYLSQLQQLTGKVANHDYQSMQHSGLWSAGRGNHYLFDMNRDWVPQVHPETRGRAAAMLEWHPELVVDSHEMGPLDTYLFDPPRDPLNPNHSESSMAWRQRMSQDQAKAFDRHGWSYYTGEWYEEWYPGYTNSWAALQGAIGILYEQAGVNGSSIKQESGATLTYHEAVHHHLVSSLANLETFRSNRRAILEDYYKDRRWAASASQSGTEVLLIPPTKDKALRKRLVELLHRQGIETHEAENPMKADDVVDIWGDRMPVQIVPTGSLVIPAAQPQRRLVLSLLEFDPHMTQETLQKEREDLENHRGTRMYDITAWNLCMAYGMYAYWARSVTEIPQPMPVDEENKTPDTPSPFGYLVDGASSDIHRAAVRLLEKSCRVRLAREPFTIGGKEYQPGTLLLRRNENPAELGQWVKTVFQDLTVDVRTTPTALSQDGPDLGGNRFPLLAMPRVAVASQWPISTTSFGATWYLLDARTELRVSPINVQGLGRMDLREYNVLVLPDAFGTSGLSAILDDAVCKKLRSWVEAGGTLIAMGQSAAFLASKDRGISSVRLRRDVLDQLDAYANALDREQHANTVRVDPDTVWGTIDLPDPPAAPSEAKAKTDLKSIENEDRWMRTFRPHGAIVRSLLRADHWLTCGLTDDNNGGPALPVLLSTSYAFLAKPPVQTPVRLADAPRLRMSGLLWPEARQRWENTAYATVERVGFGQVILFASDPFFRGYFEGSGRLLLNAIVFGPGMGASHPVPW